MDNFQQCSSLNGICYCTPPPFPSLSSHPILPSLHIHSATEFIDGREHQLYSRPLAILLTWDKRNKGIDSTSTPLTRQCPLSTMAFINASVDRLSINSELNAKMTGALYILIQLTYIKQCPAPWFKYFFLLFNYMLYNNAPKFADKVQWFCWLIQNWLDPNQGTVHEGGWIAFWLSIYVIRGRLTKPHQTNFVPENMCIYFNSTGYHVPNLYLIPNM
jgi:hypothetical protein